MPTDVPEHCGEPMGWHKDPRKTAGGYWRCKVERRAYERKRWADMSEADRDRRRDAMRDWYENLSGFEYNRLLLRQRRHQSLGRLQTRREKVAELDEADREELGTDAPDIDSDKIDAALAKIAQQFGIQP